MPFGMLLSAVQRTDANFLGSRLCETDRNISTRRNGGEPLDSFMRKSRP